jgi:L-amino acid N-acyltransferase YncA
VITLHTVPAQEWAGLAEHAHRAIFGESKPTTQDRIDFAYLVTHSETDDVLAYVTCKEISPTTVYWSYGGAFPPSAKRVLAYRCFQSFVDEALANGYQQILFLVQNDNPPMLKMAAHAGFKIVGLRHVEGVTLLEHQYVATQI